jgi:putative membrane protein
MQIIRTVVWVVLLIALLIFGFNNWNVVQVKIWENLILETKLPVLLLVAFLLGMLPMWLLHTGTRWRLNRQISSLKDAATITSAPSLSTTSLAEAQPENPAN